MAAVVCTSGRVALSGCAPTASPSAGAARPVGAALSARAHATRVALPVRAVSSRISASRPVRGAKLRVTAAETEAPVTAESYEVNLSKPLQVKFGRGNDGGAYVVQVAAGAGKNYAKFQPGDKIKKVSASFGAEVWDAENYGQVMYAVKTRNGDVFFELESRGGDMSVFDVIEKKNSQFKGERNSGNYGAGTQAVQMKNFVAAKELNDQREAMFTEALAIFKEKKYDEALVTFENVVGLEPPKYMGDDFAKTSPVFRVAQYNVACCYSMINQEEAGLEALKSCLMSGFSDYKMVRNDPSLAFLRESEDFPSLINAFDEPLINENAMKVLKGFFGKKK